jgi:hypothetical protein
MLDERGPCAGCIDVGRRPASEIVGGKLVTSIEATERATGGEMEGDQE